MMQRLPFDEAETLRLMAQLEQMANAALQINHQKEQKNCLTADKILDLSIILLRFIHVVKPNGSSMLKTHEDWKQTDPVCSQKSQTPLNKMMCVHLQ